MDPHATPDQQRRHRPHRTRRPALAAFLLASAVAAMALVAGGVSLFFINALSEARQAEQEAREVAQSALYVNTIRLAGESWQQSVGGTQQL